MGRIFTNSRKRAIRYALLLGFLLVSYQNCSSGVNFDASDALKSAGVGDPQQNVGTDPTVDPNVDPVVDPAGDPVYDGHKCTTPRVSVGDACVCPAGSNDIGNSCLTCGAGTKFNPMTLKCEQVAISCNPGETYDGHKCVAISPSCDSYVEVTSPKFAIPPRNMNQDGTGKTSPARVRAVMLCSP